MTTPNYSTTCAVCLDPISPSEPTMVAYTATGERVSVHPACGLTLPKKPEADRQALDANERPKRYCGAERGR